MTAHIRHEYTNYDNYLKSMQWADARKMVQQACLDLLVQWRGDDEDDGELEDMLREVIVISDDEHDHEEIRQNPSPRQAHRERSESVEFISANDLKTQSVNYAAAGSALDHTRSPSLDIKYPEATPLMRNRPLEHTQHRLEQMGAQRYRMWEEAVDRQRKSPKMLFYDADSLGSPTSNNIEQSRPRLGQEPPETRQPPHEDGRLTNSLPLSSQDPRLIILPVSKNKIDQSRDDRGRNLPILGTQVSFSNQREVASTA